MVISFISQNQKAYNSESFEFVLRLEAMMSSGRAPKKLIIDHQEVPSSLDAVISNDDILIEILTRLPAFSIILFKSVSKRWLCLTTSPVFTLRCTQNLHVEPPSGFFLQRDRSHFIYNYVPFDIRFSVNRSPLLNNTFRFGFPYDEGNVEILQSCNGLLLCHINKTDTYYIYNPSINRFKMLPPCCNSSGFNHYKRGVRLAFDPTKSPHYKLVSSMKKYDDDDGSYIQIKTYSSETGTWSVCHDRFPNSSFLYFHHAIYWNNAIHWMDMGITHYKLDVEQLVLTSIQIPVELDRIWPSQFFESRGCLLFLREYTRCLKIYEMRKGYSGWSMKYCVNPNDITRKLQLPSMVGCYNVLCIVLGEKEEDSFFVIEACGKVLQYKFLLKTIRELYDSGSLDHKVTNFSRGFYQLYPSFASL